MFRLRGVRAAVLLVLALCAGMPQDAAAQVTASITLPALGFDVPTQRYVPFPVPVVLTVRNTGTAPVTLEHVRIEFLPELVLHSSESGAVIKIPVPAAVPAGDSVRVTWMVTHPVLFSPRAHRITCWIRRSATDSLSVSRNLQIPAAGLPRMDLSMYGVVDFTPLPDSSGYNNNAFFVRFRLFNDGDTPADSVRIRLELPPHFELSPASQTHPIVLPVLQPLPLGDPRLELGWTARYTHATRTPRVDSIVVVATGRARDGSEVMARASRVFQIAGLAPRIALTIDVPPALSYDADSVYAPHPLPAVIAIRNTGSQRAVITSARLTMAGDGAVLPPPPLRTVGTVEPGDTARLLWPVTVARADTPRTLTFTAEVIDLDGAATGTAATTLVPGEPFSLDVVDVALPDSLEPLPSRDRYASDSVRLSFRVRNASWMSQTLTRIEITPLGTGISPAVPLRMDTGIVIAPGAVSDPVETVWRISGRSADRVIAFTMLAVSHRGDSGRARAELRAPALRPGLAITRLGPDSLGTRPPRGYHPNPHERRYTVRNDGDFPIRCDSIRLVFNDADIRSAEVPVFFVRQTLAPGDSVPVVWTLTALDAADDRAIALDCEAWFDGGAVVTLGDALFAPGLAPRMEVLLEADTTLLFDAVTVYRPSPVRIRVTVRSTGTVPLRLDSVRCDLDDALLVPTGDAHRELGHELPVGASETVDWSYIPLRRDTPGQPEAAVHVFADAGAVRRSVRLSIPGRPTRFAVFGVTAPIALQQNPSGDGWLGNPFSTRFRAWNDSWVNTRLVSSIVRLDAEGVEALTALDRAHDVPLTGDERSPMIVDSFLVHPSSRDREARLIFIVRDERGESDSSAATVRIPALRVTSGEPAPGTPALALRLHPSPWNAGGGSPLAVSVTLPHADAVRIDVRDVLGRLVERLHDGSLGSGAHTVLWRAPALIPGYYVVTLSGRASTRSVPFTVTR